MKIFYAFTLCILCLLITVSSCNDKKPSVTENQQPENPKALQADNGSGAEVSLLSKKRYQGDLVEELYKELLEKNSQLNELESNIRQLKDDSRDSAEAFNAFDIKNNAYYNAANNHIDAIKDSAIKQRIRSLIDNSLSKYKSKTAVHQNLQELINKKDLTLDDLHVVLKLSQTLTMIEKYQSGNLPSAKPLDMISKTYDKVIATTDSLSKK